MYYYCCLCILIVRPRILNVVYVLLLWFMYSYFSSIYSYCCLCINCCVVLCIFCLVLFYVLSVCKCVLSLGDNPIAVNKYIISNIIYYDERSKKHQITSLIVFGLNSVNRMYLTQNNSTLLWEDRNVSRKVGTGDNTCKEPKIIHQSKTKFKLLPILPCNLGNFSGTSGKRGNLYSGCTTIWSRNAQRAARWERSLQISVCKLILSKFNS